MQKNLWQEVVLFRGLPGDIVGELLLGKKEEGFAERRVFCYGEQASCRVGVFAAVFQRVLGREEGGSLERGFLAGGSLS